MARPRKSGISSFQHDVNTSSSEAIRSMRASYGNDGYVFYFILLENIYKVGGILDISDVSTILSLANEVGVEKEKFYSMLDTAFELNLFDKAYYKKNNSITSSDILKEAEKVEKQRKRKRKFYENKEVIQEKKEVPPPEEIIITTEEKVINKPKEEKVKKENKKPYGEFGHVKLTDEELLKLNNQLGKKKTDELIERLDIYVASTGKKYKSDYATILNWVRRDGGNTNGGNKQNTAKTTTAGPSTESIRLEQIAGGKPSNLECDF